MIYYEITLIAIILVFVIDLSGFVSHVKGWVGKVLHHSPESITLKPFDCSLCMTFWVGIIYSLAKGGFSLPVLVFICLMAYLTPIISGVMRTAYNLLTGLIRKINNIFNL